MSQNLSSAAVMIGCWQTILTKHHILFSKIRKDVAKFVDCCSYDWLLADNSHEISYLTFFEKLGKISQNLLSATVLGFVTQPWTAYVAIQITTWNEEF